MGKLRIIGFAVLAAVLCYAAALTWIKRTDLVKQFAYLEKQYAELAQRNADLRSFAQSIQLDSVKEMEVKQRLNYAKPGETLVVFISPSPTPVPQETNTVLDWLRKLFGR